MNGRVKLANAMISAGNYGPAKQVLSQHLKNSPADPEAVYLYGTALYREGDGEQAEAVFRRLVALTPMNARAHYSLGMALARLGRTHEAQRALGVALQVEPDYARAREALTRLDKVATHETPAPNVQPSTVVAAAEEHLTRGDLLGSGHRRVSSYAWHFSMAVIAVSAGLILLVTEQPGRLQWFAERPPFQLPSLDFLHDRYEATGLEVHRLELETALRHVATVSDLLDRLVLITGAGLVIIGAILVIHAILAAALTQYRVYERRIEVATGVLSRRGLSAWLYEIIDVELRQSPMLTLSGNAEVRIYLPQTGYAKPSRFNDRSKLRIIGFGSRRDQEQLWEEIRDAALKERRIMRKWYL